jgi:hypothetical protein
MKIDLRGWAVFAGDGPADAGPGLLFEGRPRVADHVYIWSNGDEVHIEPHYTFSTWDHFWADDQAQMHATGFQDRFPFTLGDQRSLRDGFLSILDRAARVVAEQRRSEAVVLRLCAARIRALAALR